MIIVSSYPIGQHRAHKMMMNDVSGGTRRPSLIDRVKVGLQAHPKQHAIGARLVKMGSERYYTIARLLELSTYPSKPEVVHDDARRFLERINSEIALQATCREADIFIESNWLDHWQKSRKKGKSSKNAAKVNGGHSHVKDARRFERTMLNIIETADCIEDMATPVNLPSDDLRENITNIATSIASQIKLMLKLVAKQEQGK